MSSIDKPTFNDKFYKLIQNKNLLTNTFDYNNIKLIDNFYKVGYFLELEKNGFEEWIYVEFDKLNNHILDHKIPTKDTPPSRIIDETIHNIYYKTNRTDISYNMNEKIGRLKFTPFSYGYDLEIGRFNINNNLIPYTYDLFYGCMQIYLKENLLFAYNGFNSVNSNFDIGIGNDTNELKTLDGQNWYSNEWTFALNSNEYSKINLKIYAITNDNNLNIKKNTINLQSKIINIDKIGLTHGDKLLYNSKNNTFTQTKVPYNIGSNESQPNFIIAITGQSNSQGYDAYYNNINYFDQPHDNIFAFNGETQNWETASLTNNSIGVPPDKVSNTQSLAFHFAKRIVEAYPYIRPGIINFGIGGQSIGRWINVGTTDSLYNAYNDAVNDPAGSISSNYTDTSVGSIFRIHKNLINNALEKLVPEYRKINVILWHQGESDCTRLNEIKYYETLLKIIEQYRSLEYCNSKTPFIAGTPTANPIDFIGFPWNKTSEELLKLNYNGDPYSKCVYSTDNYSSYSEYGYYDQPALKIHFGPEGHRKMGTQYFNAYRNIFNDSF